MASAASRGHVRRAQLALLRPFIAQSRAERFAARQRGDPLIGFGVLASLPRWATLTDQQAQREVAAVAAVLHFRPHIDGELSGAVLGDIATEVGEDAFDRACAAPVPPPEQCADPQTMLPVAGMMIATGQVLLHRGLPAALSARYSNAQGDAAMRALADAAYACIAPDADHGQADYGQEDHGQEDVTA